MVLNKAFLSTSFFEYDPLADCPKGTDLTSWKERWYCLLGLLHKIAVLPFAFAYKVLVSLFRIVGVLLGFSAIILTLGFSSDAREFFLQRMISLGTDIADWVLLPFSIMICLVRLTLASLIAPAISRAI